MRAIRTLLALAIALAAAAAGWLYYFSGHPLELPRTPYEFTVRSGASVKSLARQLADDGLFAEPHSFWVLARALGRSGAIQAGTYRLERPVTPRELLDKLARTEVPDFELDLKKAQPAEVFAERFAKAVPKVDKPPSE